MCVPANLQTGQNDMSEEWEEMDVGEKRLKTSPHNDGHKREPAAPVKHLTPDEYRAALEAENKSAAVVGWRGKLMRILGLEK